MILIENPDSLSLGRRGRGKILLWLKNLKIAQWADNHFQTAATMDDIISIRLEGNGVSPGFIRSREIAEIIEGVEDMIIAEVIKADPKCTRDEIIVGIYKIENKSIGLAFKTTVASLAIPAFIGVTNAISHEGYEHLTPQALKSLRTISRFTKKHYCNAIFAVNDGASLAVLRPSIDIPEDIVIEGRSEIIGKVLRVGGKTPKALIETTDGSLVYCDVGKEEAKSMGHMLYSLARFTGKCTWNTRTKKLIDLHIDSVEQFADCEIASSLQKLALLAGACFSAIEDVPSYVSKLRREDIL